MNVTTPLRRLAMLIPDTPAIIRADDTIISYAELERRLDRLAGALARQGVSAGDIVGVSMAGPDESIGLILALALARIGAASADPALPDSVKTTRLPTEAHAASPAHQPDAPVVIGRQDKAICRIFASSGTTGLPKPIAVDHATLATRVASSMRASRDGPVRRIIAMDYGGSWAFTAMLRTLWLGGTLVLTNPHSAPAAIARHRVTHLMTSPLGLQALLDAMPATPDDPPALQSVVISGSRLPTPLRAQAEHRLCPNIHIHLGASEAGGIASGPAALLASRPGGAGILHDDVDLQIVDEHGGQLPHGIDGIVRVRGPAVVSGYADGTPPFEDGWFYPGDIGATWPDGLLTLSGRTGEIINVGGVKLNPALIEDALLDLPGVTQAAVFGVADKHGIERPWAAIVPRAPIEQRVLDQFCADRLAGTSPAMILQLKTLPRTANGKVRKDLLISYARTHAPAPI
jgi:acyl-coenzyme A synthetase/AMP-(fatty) acid ligase